MDNILVYIQTGIIKKTPVIIKRKHILNNPEIQLICNYYQKDECINPNCKAIHIPHEEYKKIERKLNKDCCNHHNSKCKKGPNDIEIMINKPSSNNTSSVVMTIPKNRLKNDSILDNLTILNICIHFQKSSCYYGDECSYLHVCPDWFRENGMCFIDMYEKAIRQKFEQSLEIVENSHKRKIDIEPMADYSILYPDLKHYLLPFSRTIETGAKDWLN